MERSPGGERAKTRRQLAAAIDRGEAVDWERFTGDETLAGFRVLDLVAQAHRSIGRPDPRETPAGRSGETSATGFWGPFTLLAQVGSGSFGEVYRAYDPALEREVALKLRRPSDDLLNTRRHLEEARKLARVRHPGVLVVHGVDIHDGRVGLWTDLVQGRTLSERLALEGRLPPAEVARIGIELCRALAAIHTAGLVHGDLKTANVLIEAGSGRIVLVDFGSATLLARESFSAEEPAVSGTPIAMAPELLRGDPPGPQSDVYALGVLLFELLTERHPIGGRHLSEITARHERGERLRLHEAVPEIPAALVEVVEQALAANPADRPGSAPDMERLLAAVLPALGPGGDAGRETLRELSARLGPLPDRLARYLARETAGALAAFHAEGRIHRDLSLETIAIRDGRVVEILNEAPRTGAPAHDDLHAAPEMLQGEALADGRADLFALGIVLHQLLTGRHPFPERDPEAYRRRVAAGRVGESGAAVGTADLSSGWRAILDRLLAPDPRDRFQSAVDLGAALDEGAGPRAADTPPSAPRPRFCLALEPAFCGRTFELAELLKGVQAAAAGAGRVFLVVGGEGSGKSRLLEELMQRMEVAGEKPLIVAASCAPATGGTIGSPGLFRALERHFGLSAGRDPSSAEPAGASSLLASLIRHRNPSLTSPPGGINPEMLPNLLVEEFVALAKEHPTVVVLDDLHLAEKSELQAFLSLGRAARELPLVLIAAIRPEVDHEWRVELDRLPHAQSFLLGGLDAEETRAFLAAYLHSAELVEEIGPEIAHRSDGNPFVLLEFLRGLEACGQIARLPDRRFVRPSTATRGEIPIPGSVAGSIRGRAARLSRLGRDVLEMASCSGLEFDPLLVGGALGVPPLALFAELIPLEQDGWIEHTDLSGYIFASHHVREAIYSGLPVTLRQSNHLALADAQERDLPPAPDAVTQGAPSSMVSGSRAVELCRHFLRSGVIDRARPYLEPALDHLTAGFDRRAVLDVVDTALANEAVWSDGERIALRLREASQLATLGHPKAASDSYAAALLLAEGTGERVLRARVRIELGSHLLTVGRVLSARAVFGQAVDLAESEGDQALLARALERAGYADNRLGRSMDAIAECERALRLALAGIEPRVACGAARVLGDIHLAAARGEIARDFYQQALVHAQEIADPTLQSVLLNGLGNALVHLGDWDGAERQFGAQIAFAHQAGDPMAEGLGTGSMARLLYRRGQAAEAGRLWERLLVLVRRHGYRRTEISALGDLAMVRSHDGLLAETRRLAQEAVAVARAIGARISVHAASLLTAVAIYGGDRRGARALLAGFNPEELDPKGSGHILRCILMGLIATHEEDSAAAVQAYEQAVSLARTSGSRWELASSLMFLGRALVPNGGERARLLLEETRSIAGEIGNQSVAVNALAFLAGLPGGDLAAAEVAFQADGGSLGAFGRTEVAFQLWLLTGRRPYLDEAHRILIHLRDHAPPEYRESILTAIPLHRQIRAAWMQEVA
jgi:serine/threonine protein kinase/tetratricopeptide (TPR) repeat protein